MRRVAVSPVLSLFPCCGGSQWTPAMKIAQPSPGEENLGLRLRVRTG